MEKEKKLVTLSMVVLFFSLIVVYSLFYQVKGETIFGTLRSIPASTSRTSLAEKRAQAMLENGDSTVNDFSGAGDLSNDGKIQFHENRFVDEGDSFSDITVGNDANQTVTNYGGFQNASTDVTSYVGGDGPTILSGTELYFGSVDSIELLGLEPEYILKDYKGFYYSKFAQEPLMKTTVQKLGGNIYSITSDAELVKNELFGDKISFVNLPEYKNKLVIMGVSVNSQYWLIQMGYDKYHHAKKYLKSLFI